MSTNKDLNLPNGWFPEEDIKEYRKIYNSLNDNAVTAEVGNLFGRSLCSVADIIKERNITVHCFDGFGTISKAGDNNYYNRFGHFEKIFKDNLEKFEISENCCIHKGISHAQMSLMENDFFDFIFIDGDHSYGGVKEDISASLPKLKIGGVMAGDDYNHPPLDGLRKAVHEAFGEDGINKKASFWIINKWN